MDLVLCHMTADFDTLGAAVGVTRLLPGARIVLTGGCHPTVRDFLALHRDEYSLIERRSVNPETIRTITVVDTQWSDRLGTAAEWLTLPNVEITIYDHHSRELIDQQPSEQSSRADTLIPAQHRYIDTVGSASTLVAEQLQRQSILLNPIEATVMALGVHVDTGSLTFDHTTVRDAAALTWLMEQGANPRVISEYVEPGLSPQLQDILPVAIHELQSKTINGITVSWVLLSVESYIAGLSSLTSQVMSLTESDILLLAARYPATDGDERLTIIGRSRGGAFGKAHLDAVNLGTVLQKFGGGGHAKAAALALRGQSSDVVFNDVIQQVSAQIPPPPTARDLMSSPVRTVRPDVTIAEAHRILLRYGHSGLSIVNAEDHLVGIISRRDLDIALHHNFSHAPVKGFMSTNLKTITPDTSLPDIEALMVTYDIGRLPVLNNDKLVGIVTRTDVLRQLHQEHRQSSVRRETGDRPLPGESMADSPSPPSMEALMRDRLSPALWTLLSEVAAAAEERGWHLYLVGGAVRDMLLATSSDDVFIDDIDLVVDGFHCAADDAAGVELAQTLQTRYPNVKLQVHGRFQTAALLWHNDATFDSLWLDIATARTEFYPYPAANPEVEASSIRQDLYRRDFTINALAIQLTRPQPGELLDFFGGMLDLQSKHIRVLHANSFIEDPTRIFRAVRFAVRLGFTLDPQTEGYIHHAIASGIYYRVQAEMDIVPALQTRLKRELQYILEAPYWHDAIQLLDQLGALQCLHPTLSLTDRLWKQLNLAARCLKRFDVDDRLDHWVVLLEVIIAALEAGDRHAVASHLQLAEASIQRLSTLDQLEYALLKELPTCDRPSKRVQLLQTIDTPTLILIAVRSERSIRQIIWHYLTFWSQLKPPLNGQHLKAMGYKPGPQFREMLDALFAQVLDGKVGDRAEAERFIRETFPCQSKN
ncbi:MAG: CBS domain-containing protein [Cyanobacteria bacterium P01_A01_bin.37]